MRVRQLQLRECRVANGSDDCATAGLTDAHTTVPLRHPPSHPVPLPKLSRKYVTINALSSIGTTRLHAALRVRGPTPLPPGNTLHDATPVSGIAFMRHSHKEHESTANDASPVAMLQMMLIDRCD